MVVKAFKNKLLKCVKDESVKPLTTQHSTLAQSSVLSPQHSSLTQSSAADSGRLLLDLCEDLLARGRSVRFRAPGRSMYPAIREGETITVRPVSPSAVKVGDIILYRWEKGVIAHRVIRIVLDPAKAGAPQGPKARCSPSQSSILSPHHLFVLQGDSSGACAEHVKPQQILGKVVAVDRAGRRIDLYSIPSKVRRLLHPFGSRFKQWTLEKTTRRPKIFDK